MLNIFANKKNNKEKKRKGTPPPSLDQAAQLTGHLAQLANYQPTAPPWVASPPVPPTGEATGARPRPTTSPAPTPGGDKAAPSPWPPPISPTCPPLARLCASQIHTLPPSVSLTRLTRAPLPTCRRRSRSHRPSFATPTSPGAPSWFASSSSTLDRDRERHRRRIFPLPHLRPPRDLAVDLLHRFSPRPLPRPYALRVSSTSSSSPH